MTTGNGPPSDETPRPYHPYHTPRPPYRRRPAPPRPTPPWPTRRPRSPPPRPRPRPTPHKPFHRPIPYHNAPPLLPRSLQSRLRPSSRSPPPRPPPNPPYRGEPGPSHRVDPPSDRQIHHPYPRPYRPDYDYSRPTKPYHPHHRPVSPPHHPPYRGEPGPLYRTEHPRDDRRHEHSPWFRHPAKVHKPAKGKKRRLHPHAAAALRAHPGPPPILKPESPILARVGFPPGEGPKPPNLGQTPGGRWFAGAFDADAKRGPNGRLLDIGKPRVEQFYERGRSCSPPRGHAPRQSLSPLPRGRSPLRGESPPAWMEGVAVRASPPFAERGLPFSGIGAVAASPRREPFNGAVKERANGLADGDGSLRLERGASDDADKRVGAKSDVHVRVGEKSDVHSRVGEKGDVYARFGEKSAVHTRVGEKSDVHARVGEKSAIHARVGEKSDVHTRVGEKSDVYARVGEKSDVYTRVGEKSDVHARVGEKSDVHARVGEKSDVHARVGEKSDVQARVGEKKVDPGKKPATESSIGSETKSDSEHKLRTAFSSKKLDASPERNVDVALLLGPSTTTKSPVVSSSPVPHAEKAPIDSCIGKRAMPPAGSVTTETATKHKFDDKPMRQLEALREKPKASSFPHLPSALTTVREPTVMEPEKAKPTSQVPSSSPDGNTKSGISKSRFLPRVVNGILATESLLTADIPSKDRTGTVPEPRAADELSEQNVDPAEPRSREVGRDVGSVKAVVPHSDAMEIVEEERKAVAVRGDEAEKMAVAKDASSREKELPRPAEVRHQGNKNSFVQTEVRVSEKKEGEVCEEQKGYVSQMEVKSSKMPIKSSLEPVKLTPPSASTVVPPADSSSGGPTKSVSLPVPAQTGTVPKFELRSVLSSLQLQSSSSPPAPIVPESSTKAVDFRPSASVPLPSEPKKEKRPPDAVQEKGFSTMRSKPRDLGLDLRSVLSSPKQETLKPVLESVGVTTPKAKVPSPCGDAVVQADAPVKPPDAERNPVRPVSSRLELRSSPSAANTGLWCSNTTSPCVSTEAKAFANLQATTQQTSASLALATQSPFSVPASALSLLRSSPRARHRGSVPEVVIKPANDVIDKPTLQLQKSKEPFSGVAAGQTNALVEEIHGIEEKISAVERKLAQLKGITSSDMIKIESKTPTLLETETGSAKEYASIAEAVARRADMLLGQSPRPVLHPMNAALRLVLTQNQAKAAAAEAEFRHICSNVELGLDTPQQVVRDISCLELSEKRRAQLAAEISGQRTAAAESGRKLAREYNELRDTWKRRLKSARDKKSKEKREAIRERDRYLVLCTKGQNARLSSRTSSGRMSTKIFPSLSPFGQSNGTADVDALLAEIAVEGGTPGSKDIWSKTLAEVPDQEPWKVPLDCTSVLVENPLTDFLASRAVNPWRFEEKLIYLEKFLMYPKNFRKIASFLQHKSSQECSYFYYRNKIDLGLKQLCKESSTMKRKGTLRSHIVNLAKKRSSFESEELISLQAESFLNKSANPLGLVLPQKIVIGSDPLSSPTLDGGHSGINDKRRTASTQIVLKKRLYAEVIASDSPKIDRDLFSQAIAKFGTDWKHFPGFTGLAGMSSTHFREYYRKNRRKLRIDGDDKIRMGRSPSLSLRHSPRISPKSSPRVSSSPPQRKHERGLNRLEPTPMMLSDRSEFSITRKKPRQSMSPPARSSASLNLNSGISDPSESGRIISETETRKNKTATWTPEEGETFKQLFRRYPRDWKKISQLMTPKTPTQVKGYWRTVANEVGSGHSADSTKASKTERKKSKRSNSEGRHATKRERQISPEKSQYEPKESSSRKGSPREPREETESKEGKIADVLQERNDRKEFVNATKSEPRLSPSRSSGSQSVARSPSDSVGITDHAAASEDPSNRRRQSEVVAPKNDNDMRESWSKLPQLLRSAPPMLRSVPLDKKPGPFRSVAASPLASPRTTSASKASPRASPTLEDAASDKRIREGQRDNKFRRAAESYGVLELLGSRLNEAADGKNRK